MALEKQTLSFPFFLGRDGGSDPKVVRESLLEAKNVVHDTEGKLSKRPPLKEAGQQNAGDFAIAPLVAATEQLNLCAGKYSVPGSTSDMTLALRNNLRSVPTCKIVGKRLTLAAVSAREATVGKIVWGSSTFEGADIDIFTDSTSPNVGGDGIHRHVNFDSGVVVAERNPVPGSRGTNSQVAFTSRGFNEVLAGETIDVPGVVSGQPGETITVEDAWTVYESKIYDAGAPFNQGALYRLYAVLSSTGSKTLTTYLYDESGTDSVLIASDSVTLNADTSADCVGIYHTSNGATSGFRVIVQGRTGSPYSLYEIEVDYTGTIDDNSGSYFTVVASGLASCTELTSFAAADSAAFVTATGPSTEPWDILHKLDSGYYCRVPRGSRLVTHAFGAVQEDRQYMVLYLGDSYDKVKANSITTIGTNPTEVQSYILVSDELVFSTWLYSAEAVLADTASEWQVCSPAIERDGKYLVALLTGATVPSISVVEFDISLQVKGRVPVVSFGADFIAAVPQLMIANTGAVIGKPYTNSFYLRETTGGSLTLNGKYSYKLVPVYKGTGGQFIQGKPTDAVEITLTGANTAVSLIHNDELNPFSGGIGPDEQFGVYQHHVYRTEANGSSYKYAGSMRADTNSFSDTVSDSGLSTPLYIDISDGFDHEAPPPAADIWVHEGRLWMIPADASDRVWYSRKSADFNLTTLSPAGEGITFNLSNSLSVGPAGTPLRGTSFGGACIVFTERSTVLIGGAGPDSAGAGSFTAPQELAIPPMTDANSLVNTGKHLLYKAGTSWILLDRGFNDTDVGNAVLDYADNSALAAVARTHDTVQILLDDGVTSLVFSTDKRQWFVWEYNLYGTLPSTGEDGIVTLDRIVRREKSDAIVAQFYNQLYEEPATDVVFRDSTAGRDYTMAVETRWFNLNQFAGFQRLYEVALLGEYKDQHTITLKIYYDYDDSTPAETITKTFTASATPYIIRWQPAKQVNRAFKVRVEETSPGGTTYESFTLTGFEATIGVKPRTHYTTGETA